MLSCSLKGIIAQLLIPGKDGKGRVAVNELLFYDGSLPNIIREDLTQGFLLLEDLGDTPYLDKLNEQSADALYGDALTTLINIQQADSNGLPEYDDDLLQSEMRLMPEWFLQKHLNITPDIEQQAIIDRTFTVISAVVSQQPQVFVHRDYHSRNLMLSAENNPGVIDYQDAVLGPITYDLVSLLRDCYIAWPVERLKRWALDFKAQAEAAGLMRAVPEATFIQWFDYMGLQRHLKVLGIFARLNHRDGKPGYLDDLPLTLRYFMEVGKKYPLVRPLTELFDAWEIPQTIADYPSTKPTTSRQST